MEANNVKVLVFGATGFIGKAVSEGLSNNHDVHTTTRFEATNEREHAVDLLSPDAVRKVIELVQPEVIINAAGIIDPNADVSQNVTFTDNILNGVVESGLVPKRIITFGSAAEYGLVSPDELPVSENLTLRAGAGYGHAKILEEEKALSYRDSHDLPVVVARIFNPIGPKMADKFLVSRLKSQIKEYQRGARDSLEISRKDSTRDYVAISDIASAIRALAEGEPKHSVYNIGSGTTMSNGDLLQLMVKSSKIEGEPEVRETSQDPEPTVASKADITRMKQDFNWEPRHSIADTVEEIMND